MFDHEYRPALSSDWQIAVGLSGEIIGFPIRQGRSALNRKIRQNRAATIKRSLMQKIGIEDIVETHTTQAIKHIESKKCEFCKVENWQVILILARAYTGLKMGFRMVAAVQCPHCKGIDKRQWNFDPIGLVKVNENE